jgi:hypothetical protein
VVVVVESEMVVGNNLNKQSETCIKHHVKNK